jgi:bifunctional non-homologous end joining protein LigD
MNLLSQDMEFKDGHSNKEYHVQLVLDGDNYHVDCQWGRIGSALSAQTKITSTDQATAEKVYNKVLKEKIGKGYVVTAGTDTEAPVGVVAPITSKAVSGIIPQLLNPIEEDEVERFLRDDEYGAQEKKDGKHVTLKCDNGIHVYNRKGQEIACPRLWDVDVGFPILIDGEMIGDS